MSQQPRPIGSLTHLEYAEYVIRHAGLDPEGHQADTIRDQKRWERAYAATLPTIDELRRMRRMR